MDRVPKAGELYKDAANKVYQIAAVAVHAGTGEQMAVYQAMYGEFGIYTMPLKQFFQEIDPSKYPQAAQKHLFEKIERTAPPQTEAPAGSIQKPELQQGGTFVQALKAHTAGSQPGAATAQARPRTQSPAESRRVMRRHEADPSRDGDFDYEKRRRQLEEREQRREMFRRTQNHESASEELRANPCLLKFLEAETYEEKFQVLHEIQDDITDRLIDDIAVVLDVVIPEGELHSRFRQLQSIILTRQKYEITRLR